MGKASEIWKEIKPKIGEMLMAVNDIETRAEKAQEEAYQKGVQDTKQHWVDAPRSCAYKLGYENGLNDAWECARKIRGMTWDEQREVFGTDYYTDIIALPASECIEKIQQYEQEKVEKEEQEEKDSVTAEEVMRQYLDTFCKHNFCAKCPLHTPDFTCGRGYHFLTHNRISDEEVRRAYAEVLQKMKG